jgi:cytochrome c biogenesis protein CcmG/thiol:disulfide interchange protein DsbE
LVAFGVLLAVQHRDEPSIPRLVQQHRPVPDFHLTTLDDKPIDTASLAGKTYVVNFFNSWCIPCQQEAPALQAFYEAHKHERDFAMIGVVRDDEESAVRNYVAARKVAWPVALAGADRTALDFGTTGQPETFVIAPDGVAVCGALGPSTQAALETWLRAARSGQECV